MTKKGEWLLVSGANYFSIQPMFCCDVCLDLISTFDPPERCPKCGSENVYKGNLKSVRIEIVEE